MKARILERWDMEFRDPQPGDEPWWFNWVLGSPKQASVHVTSAWHAYNSLLSVLEPTDVTIAHEYFGGTGAQALMIESVFPGLHGHHVQDYSAAAVGHMMRELPAHILVRQADSYSQMYKYPPDLVGLDFGDLTVWRTREGEPQRRLMDHVFGQQPKAVVLTDIACRYLHLHRKRYETLLGTGTCDSYETYLYALAGRLNTLYGYELVAGFMHTWSTVMALVPAGQPLAPGRFIPTPYPPSPAGLVLDRSSATRA